MVSTQKVCNELKMVLQFTFSQINWFPNEQFSELKCFANAERYVYFFMAVTLFQNSPLTS